MLLPRSRTKLEEFLPHVMAMVQGDSRPALPSNVALSYIRNAAIEFAKLSSVLRRTERIKIQDGNTAYPLVDEPDEEHIYRLVAVSRENGYLPPLRAHYEDSVLYLDKGQSYSTSDCEDQYMLVDYVVIPTRNACKVDDILYTDWHDAIVDGALSKIHLMPQRPWTSGVASRERDRAFRTAAGEARVKFFTDRAGTESARVRLPLAARGC